MARTILLRYTPEIQNYFGLKLNAEPYMHIALLGMADTTYYGIYIWDTGICLDEGKVNKGTEIEGEEHFYTNEEIINPKFAEICKPCKDTLKKPPIGSQCSMLWSVAKAGNIDKTLNSAEKCVGSYDTYHYNGADVHKRQAKIQMYQKLARMCEKFTAKGATKQALNFVAKTIKDSKYYYAKDVVQMFVGVVTNQTPW